MPSRLLIYDTSNYIDLPIGGQLTSISNFLLYLTEKHRGRCKNVILVGVTDDPDKVGHVQSLEKNGIRFRMLPVALAGTQLHQVKKSLRVAFAKGLLKYGRSLHITRHDCNYIHTPEAYGIIKLLNPRAACVVFSHGSFFNMEQSFRFFKKNILIRKGFMLYIKRMLRRADFLFALDDDSYLAYQKYNKHLKKVLNSVICPKEQPKRQLTGSLIFVGRLSKGKNIPPIIEAVKQMPGRQLWIVGDGEEYANLSAYASEDIRFTGAVAPAAVRDYILKADILVMNSLFEGIPMTILEALSLGIPVISTPVGGIPSVLAFGKDSESTDGTAETIRQKAALIYASYPAYSKSAYEHSKRFDYLTVNRDIYQVLKKFWK